MVAVAVTMAVVLTMAAVMMLASVMILQLPPAHHQPSERHRVVAQLAATTAMTVFHQVAAVMVMREHPLPQLWLWLCCFSFCL